MMINYLFAVAKAGQDCKVDSSAFFGFPHWYQYLPAQTDGNGVCAPAIGGINDIWLIVAAVIGILLRIAAIATVIVLIYGGIQYTTSQGDPETTAKAKSTIVNGLIGLAIAVMAASIITFIAESIS